MAVFHRMRGTRSAEYRRKEDLTSSSLGSRGKWSSRVTRRPRTLEPSTKRVNNESLTPCGYVNSAAPMTPIDRLTVTISGKPPNAVSSEAGFDIMQQRLVPGILGASPNTPATGSNHTPTLDDSSEQRRLQLGESSTGPRLAPSSQPLSEGSGGKLVGAIDHGTTKLLDNLNPRPSSVSSRTTGSVSRSSQGIQQLQPELSDDVFSTSLRHSIIHNGPMSPPCLLEPGCSPCAGSDQQHRPCDHESDYEDTISTDDEHAFLGRQGQTNQANSSTETTARGESFPQGCFLGYSLPTTDHASSLVVKQPPRTTAQPRDTAHSLLDTAARPDNVRVLSDESENPLTLTAAEELLDDLGYLGEAVI